MDSYVKLKLLGQGSFGSVFLVREKRPNGRLVCAKVLRHAQVQAPPGPLPSAGGWSVEAAVMKKLRHPNLIRLLASSKQLIIMEYCSGGDLSTHLRAGGGRSRPSEDKIWFWFVQLALALHHMHALRILHRDVKTANVFLSNDGFLVLGDLGIARDLGGAADDVAATVIGTPLYMAPEMFEGKTYTFSSDVWALGCLLYELCAGVPPFTGANTPQLMRRICSGKYPPLPATSSPALVRLVSAMLAFYPEQRPTMDAVLRDPSLQIHLQRYAADWLGSRSLDAGDDRELQVLTDQLARLGVHVNVPRGATDLGAAAAADPPSGRPASARAREGLAAVDDALERQLMAIREQERQEQLRVALQKLQEMRLQQPPGAKAAEGDQQQPSRAGALADSKPSASLPHLPGLGRGGTGGGHADDVQWKAPVVVDGAPASPSRERKASSGGLKDGVLAFRGVPRAGVPLTARARDFATRIPVCRDVRELRKQEAAKIAHKYRQELDVRHGPRRGGSEREVRADAASGKGGAADKETDGAILQAMAELQQFIQARRPTQDPSDASGG